MTTPADRFSPVAIALHWAIAACVAVALVLAWTMDELDRGATKDAILALHKSVGLTILLLTAARLLWRLTHRAPAWPAEMPALQRTAAWGIHVLLYAATLALPLTGYLSVAARGRETVYFGLFAVPQWAPLNRALSRTMENAHAIGQYALYLLLAAHIGAALYHQFIQKDRLLARMWPARAG